jgi:putative ABC transport system permease protein
MVSTYDRDGRVREVIGIIRDFNFLSFKEAVRPLAIVMGPEPNWEMAIRITKGDYDQKLETIRSYWHKYAEGAPFEYTFLDNNFDAEHRTEQKLGLIAILFTGQVIVIAGLGLLGLATFSTEQRTKEIGIRKVLGASVEEIVILIVKDFLRPVLLANLIAWPISAWLMYQWLQQFAYGVSFPWWTFIAAGVFTLLIALISASLQSRKAAIGDPVRSLRNE